VERALTLIATGTLTVAMACASKGKTVSLPCTFNPSTGKESPHHTGFNDAMWGKATRSYIKSVCSLSTVKFNAIVQAAQPFVTLKPDCVRNKATEVMEIISIDNDDDDEQAHLVYNSDDNEECKLHFFLS
jgi:hypothetical protein